MSRALAPAGAHRLAEGGPGDLDAVMAVMEAAFDPQYGEAWTRSQCAGILGLPGVWLVLAHGACGPLGFALSRVIMDEAELLLLAVLPESRGRGIGGALLEAVGHQARTRGAVKLHLEMRDDNPAARLYAAAGFSEVGRRPRYYQGRDGRRRDALTLIRLLDAPRAQEG
ncbi:GNAT family N-acetyltransferase [Sphingomonas morindae]|uniref:GNAT family N-acetyltransferase n=1 Tax=Sphingomonas morindae TaxID=1541170 RepID=A0ABY4X6U9_9SPHN|nr:GNAT family N-acetyltransferase [Sphingomonas morindae]USI72611.1 GNAT family N-acetyltransferase [Sphingomonas morindae]